MISDQVPGAQIRSKRMKRFLRKKADACPKVRIANATDYPVTGKISYINKNYLNGSKDQVPRKFLVTEITASVSVNGDMVQAAPFNSPGVSSNQFAVVQNAEGYAVTCLEGQMTREMIKS